MHVQELHSDNELLLYECLHEGLLNVSAVDFLDESDELLSPKFQLVYAWGTECALPSVQERVLMVQHVLQVLMKDDESIKLLFASSRKDSRPRKRANESIGTKCVSLADRPERYGSLPSLRLIPGARPSVLLS